MAGIIDGSLEQIGRRPIEKAYLVNDPLTCIVDEMVQKGYELNFTTEKDKCIVVPGIQLRTEVDHYGCVIYQLLDDTLILKTRSEKIKKYCNEKGFNETTEW